MSELSNLFGGLPPPKPPKPETPTVKYRHRNPDCPVVERGTADKIILSHFTDGMTRYEVVVACKGELSLATVDTALRRMSTRPEGKLRRVKEHVGGRPLYRYYKRK